MLLGVFCAVCLLAVGSASGKALYAQESTPGLGLADPARVTVIVPGKTLEPQAPPTQEPAEPTAAPTNPPPVATAAPPVATEAPPPPPTQVPALPTAQAPIPTQAPPAEQPAPPAPQPVQPQATDAPPAIPTAVPPVPRLEPTSTRIPARVKPTQTAAKATATATDAVPTQEANETVPDSVSIEPLATLSAPTRESEAEADAQPQATRFVATTTPAAVAEAPRSNNAARVVAAPEEAPLEALPQPSLEGSNLVYAAVLRQIDAQNAVIAGCVTNIGLQAETGVELAFELRAASARVLTLHVPGSSVAVNTRQVNAAFPVINPGEMRRVEIWVRTKAPLTAPGYRVLVRQARWLAGNVRLACEPSAMSSHPLPQFPVVAENARFTIDGQRVEPAQALQLLRLTPVASMSRSQRTAIGALEKTSPQAAVITTPALFSVLTAALSVLAAIALAATFGMRRH